MERSKKIIWLSIQGILVNTGLVLVKMLIAWVSGSLAIFLDAISNLTDGLSSLVIMIATRLSKRARNKKHPFGFGRIEYLGTLVVALLILFTGYQSLMEAIDKIFHPSSPDYSWISFVILGIAALVRFLFGSYLKKKGQDLHAQSVVAAGKDAIMDSVVSVSVIAAALFFVVSGINLDGYVGVIISLLIIKTAIEILLEGTSSLIGNRTEAELTSRIIQQISAMPEVLGAYDLILHDYGPDTMMGSVHVEVTDDTSAHEIDALSRQIVDLVYDDVSVMLTVGVYASNSREGWQKELKKEISQLALSKENILQIHGFYLNEKENRINFDLVYSYRLKDPDQFARIFEAELQQKYPVYHFRITMDFDYALST